MEKIGGAAEKQSEAANGSEVREKRGNKPVNVTEEQLSPRRRRRRSTGLAVAAAAAALPLLGLTQS